MITNRIKSKPITMPNIPSPTTSSSSVPTPSEKQTLSRRNKTFFERFNEESSTSISPSTQAQQQQQQLSDFSNPCNDLQPRLRRRFTFRRSLRQSVHSKGRDVDDGIRLGFLYFLIDN